MAPPETIKSQKTYDWGIFRRMLRLLRAYRLPFGVASFIALILSVLGPVKPYVVKVTVDDNILGTTGIGLLQMVGLFFLILFVEVILRYLFIYITSWIGQSVIRDLRSRIFSRIAGLRIGFFDKTPIGTLTTRTINDTEAVNRTFSEGLITIVGDVLTILIIIAYMFIVNWQLALLSLTPFPLILLATYVFKEKVKVAYHRVRGRLQDLNTFLQEHINGMKIVQLFALENREVKKFNIINKKYLKANTDTVFYYAIYFPAIEVLSSLALALILWFAGLKILAGTTQAGTVLAFVMWVNMLFRPLRMLADKFNTLQMGMVASKRVFDLLDVKDVIADKGKIKVRNLYGQVVFDNVWFAYKNNNYVLKNINFSVSAGQKAALVGATGSGKSTTVRLLTRFYDVQRGQISIDGKQISEYNLTALRRRMATVQQDVFLFNGSILDNITMNRKSVTLNEVITAAKAVGLHDFIERLPDGYHYNVTERGLGLSSGQRQIVAFIRAMISNPDILILDEATAAIDSETERRIQTATERLMKNRTSIVIAHRLSTIKNADKIIVFDQGRIIEQGDHRHLIALNGAYTKLYTMQFRREEIGVFE